MMTNSPYKILFLDIDGTILRPDDTIEESTKQAIKEVRDKGMTIFLATGRPLHEISSIAKELEISSFIGYNGAYAVHDGQDIFKTPMNQNSVEKFITLANSHTHEFVLYTHKHNIFSNIDKELIQTFIRTFHLHYNKPFSGNELDQILGITLMNVSENEVDLYKKVDSSIHLSQVNVEGLTHCYDVIRDTVNKGYAIEHILNLLHIPKEAAIAFGDGMNDKEMLQLVGEGFAMGNAHPDLLPYAKHKTTSVTDSGIYNGLKSLAIL